MKPGHRIEKTKGQRHRSPQTHSKNRKSLTRSVESKNHHARNLRKKSDKASEPFLEGLKKKRLAWCKKPRIDPESLKYYDCEAELLRIFGSERRLKLFIKLATNYEDLPNLENYLHLRRTIKEADLKVGVFGANLGYAFALGPELEKHGISTDSFLGSLIANEPSLDELSLQLMERLVARDKLPKSGPGYIEKRRQAISDSLVDYAVALMLETMEGKRIVIPPSLIVLIRDRLCGPDPDLAQFCRSGDDRATAAFEVVQFFKRDEKISSLGYVRKVLRTPAGEIEFIIDYSQWWGWFGRPVAVPLEALGMEGGICCCTDLA